MKTGLRMISVMRLIFKKRLLMRLISSSILFTLVSLNALGIPASFYQAMADMETSSYLCVKNYDAGASVTESYYNFDHLEKETKIDSQSFHPSSNDTDNHKGFAALDASISSSVSGNAHIAWQSRDINPGLYGRHEIYGMAQEDLIGVYSMERLIHLRSNQSYGLSRPDWLGCT